MGTVYADISLKNVKDKHKAELGLMEEHEIRQITVEAMVDTGTMSLIINEELRQILGLGVLGERQATLANEAKETVKIAEPVEVHWKNRDTICKPLVMAGAGKVLLGVILLEDMDLVVDPVRQELTGAHGDEIVTMLC